MRSKIFIIPLAFLFAAFSHASRSTTVTTPDASQKAAVYQRIGLTDIKIVYHSPAVKKREIWGKLVPFGKVWRAGANENTVIQFSTDVMVEGKLLKKGKYGLHTIPGENEWTIIFSTNETSWGSYFYDEKEDSIRVEVKPTESDFNEWLTYEFSERDNDSAMISLKWEKIAVPIRVNVNTREIVLDNFRKELRSLPYWYWEGTYDAAKYCLENDINLEDALKWIGQSISVQENFLNLMLKAEILKKLGKTAEASFIEKYANKIALDREITQYAYSFWYTDRAKTLKILKENNRKFNNWFTHRALGRYYSYIQDKVNAVKYLNIALKKAPQHQKEGISKSIRSLN